jgi:hypothetical protein
MRLIKGLLKWTFISLGGLVLLGMFLGNKDTPQSGVGLSSTQVAVASSPVQSKAANRLRMSIAALEEAVEENEINLQNKIKAAGGVLVNARVKSVEAIWGSPVIHFDGKNEFLNASAFLSSNDKDRAATLKRGESVSILCQTAKKIMSVALYDCRFN